MEQSPLATHQATDAQPAVDPSLSWAETDPEDSPSDSGSPTLVDEFDLIYEPPKPSTVVEKVRDYLIHARHLICSERVNLLLVFVPIGITVGFLHVDPTLDFVLNALGIIPLAVVISTATEDLASRLGDAAGALLNVTVGNAAELMIFFVALAKNQIRIVQASLLGSILANLLLVLGDAMLLGGLRCKDDLQDRPAVRTSIVLLNLGLLISICPIAVWTATTHADAAHVKREVLALSRGISFASMFVYVLYLIFQMWNQASSKQDDNQGPDMHDFEAIPLSAMRNTSSRFAKHKSTNTYQPPRRPFLDKLRISISPSRWLRWVPASSARDDRGAYMSAPQTEANIDAGDVQPNPRRHDEDTTQYLRRASSDTSDASSTVADDEAIIPAKVRTGHLPPSPPSTISDDGSDSPHIRHLLPSSDASELRDFSNRIRHSRNGMHPNIYMRRNTLSDLYEYRRAQNQCGKTPIPIALAVLVIATGFASMCTELAVDAIPMIVESWRISPILLGFIILPVVGNAAEHVTAVKLAMHNKMVLAKSVAVESSTQVVLLIAPAMVLLGWARGRDMSLQFDVYEIAGVVVASLLASFVVSYGKAEWKQGVLLISVFVIIALGAVVYPTTPHLSDRQTHLM